MLITIIMKILFLSQTMNTLFGGERRIITSPSGESYMYYESDYFSKALTLQEANKLNEQIVGEGVVLLKMIITRFQLPALKILCFWQEFSQSSLWRIGIRKKRDVRYGFI